ncbi:M28 family peptidase [Erythrobacter rubeus]|uniref:M28 family peptidase n=1 Tax=Erythrobacter rubeus TaxID=2760803 RepID=A0ABR8KM79_9SPHN|nr:M28 family peptidase [Erythrobacter rubeus]MBD2841628.1 M28 family peptidase [Erythrobacter rubeus]
MIRMGAKQGLAVLAALVLAGCATAPIASVPAQERAAIERNLRQDIAILASDEFGGRKPGTIGEERTIDYITQRMEAAGLVSGTNDPGSAWRAPVQLASTKPSTSRIAVTVGRETVELDPATAVAFSARRRELVENGQVVFVGRAAESVSDEDVTGKVVVMLGEEGLSPQRREILFAKRPAAIITVVADIDAIARVNQAYSFEQVSLASENGSELTGFTTHAAMEEALGKNDWAALVDLADTPDFSGVDLYAAATVEANSDRSAFTSYNVIGKIPGTVPDSGSIVLMAHWDHLGECEEGQADDTICNGAVDNASGVASLLELSRRLVASGPHDRDIYVVATSAEESGLLGATAFTQAPPMPLETIIAAFNFDTVAVAPAGSRVGFVGEGRTPLDPVIFDVLAQSGRELGDRAFAEQFVQRQDGWALLQEGVPAVFLSTAFGSEIVLGPYLASEYHRAGDELENIELGGAIDDLLLHEELVRRLASVDGFPAAP